MVPTYGINHFNIFYQKINLSTISKYVVKNGYNAGFYFLKRWKRNTKEMHMKCFLKNVQSGLQS